MRQLEYIKKVNIYRRDMSSWIAIPLRTIFIFFIISCLIVAIFGFVYSYTIVEGRSMYPTLNNYVYADSGQMIDEEAADSVYINRFAKFTRGDIGVFYNPSNSSIARYVVKRIVATGGDKIAIGLHEDTMTYKIYLIKNGETSIQMLNEPYLSLDATSSETFLNFSEYRLRNPLQFTEQNTTYGPLYFLELAHNEAFLLGDNRSMGSSLDSADYGPVDVSKYIGRVDIIIYQSTNNFDYIFEYFWNKFIS
ncbi:MAG: signal peptidase I [Clostridia bacterium]|nr:signal peptidase I [Clostridia bacterium]